ncbi:MAG: N-acetylmuramoyl-L-alanine amidase [Alphaproteobacteria bacterium]|nr:N-acetylmuramoyl-L-alanine amidase [Alphaproteobacteria bacterium]
MLKRLLFILSLGALLLAQPGLAQPVPATGVRVGQHADQTRFVLDLGGPVEYSVSLLDDPTQVVIALPAIDWRLSVADRARRGGLIIGARFLPALPAGSRVILDVDGPVAVRNAFLLPPSATFGHRLVVDLAQTERGVPAVEPAAGPGLVRPVSVAMPVPGRRPGTPPRAPTRPVIVIDPGHGGIDSGAIGGSGTQEKDLTLAYARELRRQLQATGRYVVMLTRDSDVFLRLGERVAVGRRAVAQNGGEGLFVSIHADSIPGNHVQGASVYTLSETASDQEAEALAAKENRSDVLARMDLPSEDTQLAAILIDLSQRVTMNQSVRLARSLVGALGRETPLLPRPHRFAGFRVLKAPDVPSVLLELGYLSNPREEQALNSAAHRAKVAQATVTAIDSYFGETAN